MATGSYAATPALAGATFAGGAWAVARGACARRAGRAAPLSVIYAWRPNAWFAALPLGEVRADDAPPYFTVFIVAHVIIGAMFAVYQAYDPPYWVQAAIWLPTTVILSLVAAAADQGCHARADAHGRPDETR